MISDLDGEIKRRAVSTFSNTESVTTAKKICISFIYNRMYARKIMDVFKDMDLRMSFKANSTINNKLLNCEQSSPYENSGSYQLLCQDCGYM
jgi:hypothetical protein